MSEVEGAEAVEAGGALEGVRLAEVGRRRGARPDEAGTRPQQPRAQPHQHSLQPPVPRTAPRRGEGIGLGLVSG